MRTKFAPLTAALLLACLGSAAQAHQVWIENSGNQARLHFGEYADNLRESSPGLLDKFKGVPTLHQMAGGKMQHIDGKLTPTAFTYATTGASDTLFAEAAYPLIERTKSNQAAMVWRPAARWVASLAQPVTATPNALDVVPTGKAGELRVVYNGTPLPKAKVTLVSPSGWAREASTGADGAVQFELPWKGQYVAEVHHTDKTPGERAGGEKFGESSFVTTLSFTQASGMESPALPAAPAAPAK
ncbi:MAG: DUF4198 domain-containing protein [Comamonadaceae bacterium]|nr:MAG: DUF4198 domain-containing protein [Comamonadaceae bacterium]